MSEPKIVLITGASGNLGAKLRTSMQDRYALRLIDLDSRGDASIVQADLSVWNDDWVSQFDGVDTVVHLAADPTAHQTWPKLIGPNIDAVANVYQAAASHGVRRVVFASSNHVMGGYQHDPEPARLTTAIAPRPGTHYKVGTETRDSTPYGTAKLFGERLGQSLSAATGLSVIAVRIGWVRPGENRVREIPIDRGSWFRQMWLSNRDFCSLMERCVLANSSLRFAIVNGMSANPGMRWDLDHTRRMVGYEPQDGVDES